MKAIRRFENVNTIKDRGVGNCDKSDSSFLQEKQFF